MSRAAILSFLLLVISAVAQAQEPAESPPPPEIEEAHASETRVVTLPSGARVSVPEGSMITGPAQSETYLTRSARLINQTLSGALASFATGAGLMMVSRGDNWLPVLVAGNAAASMLGVFLSGHILGGNGSWWGTALGGMAGSIVGTGAAWVMLNHYARGPFGISVLSIAVATIPFIAGPAAGAVLGYHLTESNPIKPARLGSTRVNAAVLPVNGGAVFSLSGQL
jgi:hypothetical protein